MENNQVFFLHVPFGLELDTDFDFTMLMFFFIIRLSKHLGLCLQK